MQANDLRRKISGFDYMLKQLDLQSAVGRDALSGLVWHGPGQEEGLFVELGRVECLKRYLASRSTVPLDKFKMKISQIWDIRSSFNLLLESTVDDVQLFEIKRFALLAGESCRYLSEVVQACSFADPPCLLPDLSEVVAVLDPRGEKLPVFHVYDEYDSRLAEARKALLALDREASLSQLQDGRETLAGSGDMLGRDGESQSAGGRWPDRTNQEAALHSGENLESANNGLKSLDAAIARLQSECQELEQHVREMLSIRLRPFVPVLKEALDAVAYWDLLVAKAGLAWKFDLVLPDILGPESLRKKDWNVSRKAAELADMVLAYEGLFHPMVKALLEAEKNRYQAVDVALASGPCLLTGANMSGKTVLLKSLALSQCLLQTGFLVPAAKAVMPLFDSVEILVHDGQDERRGLSSFGAEMQRLNGVLGRLKRGERMLLLVDELARTTNPSEGKAMVCAVLDALQELPCCAMVSTHYGPIPNHVRHLRVRGFREDWALARLNPVGSARKAGENAEASGMVLPAEAERFDIGRIQSCMDYSLVEEKPGEMPPMEALRIASLLGFDPEVLGKARAYYDAECRDSGKE